MQTQTLKVVLNKTLDNSVMFFILEPEKQLTQNVLGRSMTDWVKNACKNHSTVVVKAEKFDENFLKPYLTNSKYTIVFYNSIILLKNDDVERLIDYITFKGIKACKFSGGCAFETEYLKTAKSIFYDSVYYEDSQDYYMVEDKKQLKYATEILQERIIAEHTLNGVEITNSYVEADVKIGKGTVIFGGNTLKGNTTIGANVILKEKNVIENSHIGNECCLSGSTFINSMLEDGVFVKPYCYVEKTTIRKNCIIGSNVQITNRTIRANSKLSKEE